MLVYKFIKIPYVVDALEYGIYAGKITDFNDPYEYEGILYPDQFRVCCMTSSNKQMLMWAHYGFHRQFCVGFEIEESDRVQKVKYDLRYEPHRYMDVSEIKNSLYKKAKEWEYEKEIRIVLDINNDSGFEAVNGEYYYPAIPRSVLIGLNVDVQNDEVLEIFNYINNMKNKIEVKKCMLSNTRYEIIWDRQFDYKKYL